ncbi:MAG: abortive infection protein [Nitrososphaerota archaeon]|nr:abortive infection protein [Nitrososphaerota archaeon]
MKGVTYDAGSVSEGGFSWRPDFDLPTVRRELQIIRNDLNCNAVRITGRDLRRVAASAQAALGQGLEVWLSPALWGEDPHETLQYTVEAAKLAETLRNGMRGKVVFVIGGELTLFMRGIIEGKTLRSRMSNPRLFPIIKGGEHNKPLNEYLAKANAAVRQVFHGEVSYDSLVWEKVDWSLFDYVGVDHYRAAKIEDRYLEMLKPSFSFGKPVVVTEFGYTTTRGGMNEEGLLGSAGLGGNSAIDGFSLFLHNRLPVFGRLVRPHLNGDHVRDEGWQAHKLVETLQLLDNAGVEGAFVSTFIFQIEPFSEDPHYDLDMVSASLVKYFEGGKRGKTYPDMRWEPKESFRAVAGYYANH